MEFGQWLLSHPGVLGIFAPIIVGLLRNQLYKLVVLLLGSFQKAINQADLQRVEPDELDLRRELDLVGITLRSQVNSAAAFQGQFTIIQAQVAELARTVQRVLEILEEVKNRLEKLEGNKS